MGHPARGIVEGISHIFVQGLDVGTARENEVTPSTFANVVSRSPDLGHDLTACLIVHKQLCPLDPVHLMPCEATPRPEAVPVASAVADVQWV